MILSKQQIVEIMERFKVQNPNPKSELDFKNPFTLLVSVVLSAQATDKSVNFYTKPLYEVADTPQKILALGQEKLIEDFGGIVPDSREKLMSLPGVGRKTANVVLNVVFGQSTMPVDTHLLRICPKIGLAEGSTPEQVENSLLKNIPAEYLQHAHHWLLLHGRYVCTARNPKCNECLIRDLCLYGRSLKDD